IRSWLVRNRTDYISVLCHLHAADSCRRNRSKLFCSQFLLPCAQTIRFFIILCLSLRYGRRIFFVAVCLRASNHTHYQSCHCQSYHCLLKYMSSHILSSYFCMEFLYFVGDCPVCFLNASEK